MSNPPVYSQDPADWIRRLPNYTELGDREQSVLAAICEVSQYSQGDIIIKQETRPPQIPLLVQGQVLAGIREPKGKYVEFTVLEAPELVGFLWFMDPALRCPLEFEANSACVCLNIRSMDLQNLYDSGNALSYPILSYLYKRSAEQFRMFNDVFRRLYEKPQDTYLKLVEHAS